MFYIGANKVQTQSIRHIIIRYVTKLSVILGVLLVILMKNYVRYVNFNGAKVGNKMKNEKCGIKNYQCPDKTLYLYVYWDIYL